MIVAGLDTIEAKLFQAKGEASQDVIKNLGFSSP